MKRLIIICEGETEQQFCDDVLYKYFFEKEILIQSLIIKKSKGGIVSWQSLKTQIQNHLKQEKDVFVTTLIDLYALPNDYPNSEKNNVEDIENGMRAGIDTKLSQRFIPYIQKYEFECFIFCSIDVLKQNFKQEEAKFDFLEKTLKEFKDNPEDINNSPHTAPSKRLKTNIKSYNKIVYGACLTYEIGLQNIRNKCPRFNNWLETLEKL